MQTIFLNLIFRRIKRNRLYTTINILGLSIALTASLLLYTHVVKEFKTDRFLENGENIYRINLSGIFTNAWSACTCDGLAPAMQSDLPGIERYARIYRTKYQIKALNATDYIQPQHVIYTDNQFFQMFSFPLIAGKIPGQTEEDWCIISEKYARLCFGKENPIGKVLILQPDNKGRKPEEIQIAGVMKDIPAWSSLQADLILNYAPRIVKQNSWNSFGTETYVQLSPHTNLSTICSGIPEIFEKHNPYFKDSGKKIQSNLQPLYDVYFGSSDIESNSFWGYIPHGSRLLTFILSSVAFIIFVLAACNYMLIKMANLHRELSLLAIQKCYGATSRSIQIQLILEMILQIFAALVISLVCVKMLHPHFIAILSPKQPYTLQLTLSEAGIYLLYIITLTGIISTGLYLYIQKHLNLHSVKDLTLKETGHYDLKKILATVQMCIFCTLLFVSAIVLKQMHYLENKDLGINTENMLWVQIYNSDPVSLKSEILQKPQITHVSNSSALPAERMWQTSFTLPDNPGSPQNCNILLGDNDFLSTLGISLFEGENIHPGSYRKNEEIKNQFYEEQRKADQQGKPFPEYPQLEHQVLVNRKFVKTYGLTNPIGTLLSGKYGNLYRIVGITEDFHYQPLYKNIEPVMIGYNAGYYNSGSFNLKYQQGSRADVLTFLNTLNEKQPYHSASLNYSEYKYSDIYDKDVAFIRMINIFTLIALFIGSMGIFAFSVFLAENKKKEIAIRKVNGATEWKIMTLINGNFAKQTLIACLIGLPVGYFFIQKWLENFAYKTSLEWWIFTGIILLCIAFVTLIVSFQTWKSATLNPIESLKRE